MKWPVLHRLWGKTVEAARTYVEGRKASSSDLSGSGGSPLEPAISSNSCIGPLPEWLIRQWLAMHDIDPSIFPDRETIDSISFYQVYPTAAAPVFSRLMDATGHLPDHVFLVPWLDKGGAERVALNYVRAVRRVAPERRVVVVATHPAESPWASKLSPDVSFIEFGKCTDHLNDVEREHLLVRWLMQTSPKAVHNINSRLGFQVFERYGSVLRNRMRLYMSAFCTDFTPEGKRIGYAVEFLPRIIDHLTAVTVDNRTFRDQLMEWYAFDPKKLVVHHQPIEQSGCAASKNAVDRDSSRTCLETASFRPGRRLGAGKSKKSFSVMAEKKTRLDVLWAGRIDDQKRPDILLRIIEAAADLPFFFHVYGAAVLNRDRYTQRLRQYDNAWYYGPFDGFESLPITSFDAFLYTSQWDGLPTILLDAVWAGLPIVASDVGGIAELIVHRQTGYLVRPFDEVAGYIRMMQEIFAQPSHALEIAGRAKRYVETHHSWEHFCQDVGCLPGYVESVRSLQG
ncbi:glycosyltransferase family 4 protein [Desulfatirhabdium butyrativorans]|uniref:glycosyltransferase family 4 protein n=1 Tax=Desulfatirhabdium butyrativorans TaxID=340467 RepID=UPI00146FC4DE|nr:glycosyltransferase family 4 protein [Desulfatirhabdium butyrativorans]